MTYRIVAYVALLGLSLVFISGGIWGSLALWYRLPASLFLHIALILLWICGCTVVMILLWQSKFTYAAIAAFVIWLPLLIWWNTITPSNNRIWADDVASQLSGKVQDNVVTLTNVRNFDWHTDKDYQVRWETRKYDLDNLSSVDVALSYWMGPAIAHTLVSFGFNDGTYVTFSVEIRKESHEKFSAIAGFFKEFEMSVVAADERDILRVRTNVRDEQMYLYRVDMPAEERRALFLGYVDEANFLVHTPRFYHTFTANCTTIIYDMVKRIVPNIPMDYRLIVSGYLDTYLYEINALDKTLPFEALKKRANITERAKLANDRTDFSAVIRQDTP